MMTVTCPGHTLTFGISSNSKLLLVSPHVDM